MSYVNMIKYGLAFEQGQKKVEEIHMAEGKENSDTRVAALEEQVRQLQSKGQKKESKGGCETCNRGPHGEKKCPVLGMKCFTCNEVGHLAKSAACKKTFMTAVKSQRNKEDKVKSNAVEDGKESETDSDTEDSNRVVEEFMEVDRVWLRKSEQCLE